MESSKTTSFMLQMPGCWSSWSRVLQNLYRCKVMHNKMLHGKHTSIKNSAEGNENINSREDGKSCTQLEVRSSSINTEKEQSRNDKEESHSGKSKEKKQKDERSHTTVTNQAASATSDFISLRTVFVVVCNDNIRMTVDALLDDTSTKTYINSDVAEQLKLKGIPKTSESKYS